MLSQVVATATPILNIRWGLIGLLRLVDFEEAETIILEYRQQR
jgi:hypothetical protein